MNSRPLRGAIFSSAIEFLRILLHTSGSTIKLTGLAPLVFLTAPPAVAQIQIVMLNSEEGGISVSEYPQIANGGKVAFKGSREIGGDEVDGVYIGYGGGGVSPLVEVGTPEEIEEIGGVGMSSSGTVAYWALLRLTYPDFTGQPKAQLYIRILRGADPYEYEFGRAFHNGGPIGINNRDELFVASPQGHLEFSWDARSSGACCWGSIFLGGGTPVSVNGTYLPPAAINNSGQVAFSLRPPGEALLAVKRGEIRSIAPGSWQTDIKNLASGFESIESLGLDDSGRAVFLGRLPGGTTALYESSGTPVVLASEGDGKGFSGFGAVAVSASGQIAFLATYETPSGNRRYGIFRGFNGATDKIVAEGDRITYNGTEYEISVGGFGPRAYSDGGQIVFSGSISPPEDDGHGGGAGPASVRPSNDSGSHSGVFVTWGVADPPPDDEPPGDDPEDDPPNTFTWANDTGGAFATAANWEPAQVPVKNAERADTARFNLGAACTVATPTAATERLLVRGGDVTLDVGTYTVASTSLDAPSVSITRSGIVRVTGGALQSVNTVIGNGATTTTQIAEAHLFNSGVTWDNPGRMTVGGFSPGRLFVANGPTLTTGEARIGTDARGEAIVGGADSLWEAGSLAVGYSDEGSLIVERGGHTLADYLYIGRPEGQGMVTLDGVGADGIRSLLTVSDSLSRFWIGEGGGSGELRIIAGGMVEATDGGFLGVGSKAGDLIGTGRVSVRGFDAASGTRSTLKIAPLDELLGWIILGWEGAGRLDIEDGGLVESGESYVAKDGGVAVARVTGVGNGNSSEWLVEGLLAVGSKGLGDISLSDGGQVTTDHVIAGSAPDGRGRITVDGVGTGDTRSRLTVNDPIQGFQIGEAGGHGELLIENGGLVETPLFGWLVIGKSGASGAGTGLVTVRGFHATSGLRSTLDLPPLGNTGTFGDVMVGWGGTATLRIEDGGLVRTRSAVIGRDQGSGLAVVRGLGNAVRSTWNNTAAIEIGWLTTGTLTIEAGGEVQTAQLIAGKGAGGRGVIEVRGVGTDGFPSLLQVTEGLTAFDLGTEGGEGTLTIEDGGSVVATGDSWLTVAKGDVVVRGVHAATQMRSALDVDSTTAGYGGLVIHGGSLVLVEDGGLITSRTGVIGGIGEGTGAGIVRVRGTSAGLAAAWHSSEELIVGNSPSPGSTGILTVEADGAVTVGLIDPVPGWVGVGTGGTLSGHGLIQAGGITGGGVNNFAGTVAPGSSPGTLTIEGDYRQGAAGLLAIEIGGLEAGYDFDQLMVTGVATFAPGAKIRITFVDPNPDDAVAETFVPRTGDVFSFLVADAVSLPTGAALSDLIEFTNLPAGVVLDFQTGVVEGNTIVTGTTTSTLPLGGLRITAHPHHVVAAAGTVARFTVQAEGAAGLVFQWLRDGLPIGGATGPSFTLPLAQPSDAAPYSVIVSAGGDSVVSKVATLSITPPPRLSVTHVAGDIVLSWPTLPGGFGLQSLAAFAAGTGWKDATAPATLSNGQNVVTLPTTEPVQLFRLKYEP